MSKFSISIWPKALEAGVELRTYARVLRIETDRDGRATGAVYIDRTTGQRHFQSGGRRHPRRQRRRHAAPAAGLRQSRQQLRSGRPQPAAPHAGRRRDVGGRAGRVAYGLCRLADQPRVRRDRREPRLRQRLQLQLRDQRRGRRAGDRLSQRRARALGSGPSPLVRAPFRPRHRRLRHRRRPAPIPTTASRSIRRRATPTACPSPSFTTRRARTTGA